MSVVEESTLNSMVDRTYEGQEFLYRPIPLLVPISLGFVFLSLVASLMAELIVVPVVGATIGLIALRQIRKSQGSLSGGGLAAFSITTQVAMAVAFASMHVYSYATEVPPGYERVSFLTDISKKGFSTEGGVPGIHPDVQKLVNQKVMVKGYMYPEKTMDLQKSFVLCRDNGDCCFGGQPKPNDMIQVRMKPGNTARYRTGLVAVAGVFRADPDADGSVYQLDCDIFGPAKSQY
jgi:hypothetical protein